MCGRNNAGLATWKNMGRGRVIKWAYTKQRDELKPCPFCATAAIEQGKLADNSTDMHFRISCGNPFCSLDCATHTFAALKDAEYA